MKISAISFVRLVTFDVTNTVLQFQKSPSFYYANLASSYGIEVNKEKIDEVFSKVLKTYSSQFHNFGCHSCGWIDWWKGVIYQTIIQSGGHLEETVKEKFCGELIELFTQPEVYRVSSGFFPLIGQLLNRGIAIGALSNTDCRLEIILRNLDILKYFNFVLSSYVAGVMKPNPMIFDSALKLAPGGIRPCEALHIGDNIKLDYLAAREAGWNSILVAKNYRLDCISAGIELNQECMFANFYDTIHLFTKV